MRLFVATLRKLPPRLATYATFGVLLGLIALIYIAIGSTAGQVRSRPGGEQALQILKFPNAYASILSFLLSLGGLMAVAYSAAIAGSEWQWGTFKTAVARGEGRVYYMVVTFLAIAVLVGIGLVVAFLVGVIVAFISAGLAGISTSGIGDSATLSGLPVKLLRGWLAITEEAALGFAIATIFRSQLAGVGAGIAVYFGEQFASLFLPDVIRYLPFNAATAVVGAAPGGGGSTVSSLEPNTALVVVLAWLVGALVVSALFTERADIGG
jgi:ABC-2 type transport system permease protein